MQDPLAVLLLDNRLYIFVTETQNFAPGSFVIIQNATVSNNADKKDYLLPKKLIICLIVLQAAASLAAIVIQVRIFFFENNNIDLDFKRVYCHLQ